MYFEFSTATRIIFGKRSVHEAIEEAAAISGRALIITGKSPAWSSRFLSGLKGRGVSFDVFSVPGEPSIPVVLEAVRMARANTCSLVIGYGGGSALDAAKAVAALMTNPGDPLDYLEVVGGGKPLTHSAAPCICIPTTAGTGCEVTRNAVLISPEHRVKVSLRSHKMLPSLAVVDPELTHTLPPDITAATGMDALTQLIEPFVSNRANPLTDSICREGIRRAARWLRVAVRTGNDEEARENMALASLFGGLALANAGLGVVHGLAAPIGGMFPIPHGTVCACLLPVAVRANWMALKRSGEGSPALQRYDEIAALLTGNPLATAADGISWLFSLKSDLSIPGLSAFGVKEEDLHSVAAQAEKSSSIRGNPIKLSREELVQTLREAL